MLNLKKNEFYSDSRIIDSEFDEKNLKVSLVIPIYKIDNISWFKKCIKTIDLQTLENFEVIIVNDASPQSEVVNFLKKLEIRKNYKIINLKKNYGIGPAINAGIKAAKCKLIARMDADDVMVPNRLERQYHYMTNNPDVDLLSAGIFYIRENAGYDLRIENKVTIHPEIITKKIAKNSFWFINHPAVMFKKKSIESIGGYKDLRGLPEDYELWVRMINAGMSLRNLQEVLVGYRISSNQASKKEIQRKTEFLNKIQSKIVINKKIII